MIINFVHLNFCLWPTIHCFLCRTQISVKSFHSQFGHPLNIFTLHPFIIGYFNAICCRNIFRMIPFKNDHFIKIISRHPPKLFSRDLERIGCRLCCWTASGLKGLHRSSPRSFFVNYYFWNPSFHFQDFSF